MCNVNTILPFINALYIYTLHVDYLYKMGIFFEYLYEKIMFIIHEKYYSHQSNMFVISFSKCIEAGYW